VVIIGCGGLGQFGVQYAKLLTPSVNVVAIGVDDTKLSISKELGADIIVNSKTEDAVEKVRKLQTTKVHRE
jgi:alcohol dehydrogenase, propanol-preferring